MIPPPPEEIVVVRGLVFGLAASVPVWAVLIGAAWVVKNLATGV